MTSFPLLALGFGGPRKPFPLWRLPQTPDVEEGRALRQQEAATALHGRDPPDRRCCGLLPRLMVGDGTNGGVKKTDQRRYQPVGGSEYNVIIILGSKRENPSETDSSNTRFSKASASTYDSKRMTIVCQKLPKSCNPRQPHRHRVNPSSLGLQNRTEDK